MFFESKAIPLVSKETTIDSYNVPSSLSFADFCLFAEGEGDAPTATTSPSDSESVSPATKMVAELGCFRLRELLGLTAALVGDELDGFSSHSLEFSGEAVGRDFDSTLALFAGPLR